MAEPSQALLGAMAGEPPLCHDVPQRCYHLLRQAAHLPRQAAALHVRLSINIASALSPEMRSSKDGQWARCELDGSTEHSLPGEPTQSAPAKTEAAGGKTVTGEESQPEPKSQSRRQLEAFDLLLPGPAQVLPRAFKPEGASRPPTVALPLSEAPRTRRESAGVHCHGAQRRPRRLGPGPRLASGQAGHSPPS
jgi:hypothetical protein